MKNSSKYKVLILEDEPPIAEQIQSIIETEIEDIAVAAIAYNGLDGIKLLEKQKPDIVLCDIRMPVMDGLEFIRQSRNIAPNLRIIIISGYNEFEYARSAMQLQVVDYLLKPIEEQKLITLLENQKSIILKQRQEKRKQYVAECIHSPNNLIGFPKPSFRFPYFWPVVLHAGNIYSHIYGNDFPIDMNWSEITQSIQDALPQEADVWFFDGRYSNQIFCIIHSEQNTPYWMESLIHGFTSSLKQTVPINLVVDKAIMNPQKLGESIANLILLLISQAIFGQSNLIFGWRVEKKTNYTLITKDMRKKLNMLAEQKTYQSFEEIFHLLIQEWKQQNATQIQIQTYFNVLLHQLEQQTQIHTLDVGKQLIQSHTYTELEHNILKQVKQLIYKEEILAQTTLSANELVDVIAQFIAENFKQNITGKMLRNKFGYHEVYIANVFKKEKGVSPKKYALDIRMRKAKEMIQGNPTIRIKTVARQVGYADPLHFSRQFREYTGIYPTSYAKKFGGNE